MYNQKTTEGIYVLLMSFPEGKTMATYTAQDDTFQAQYAFTRQMTPANPVIKIKSYFTER